jgi:hypothetical protein
MATSSFDIIVPDHRSLKLSIARRDGNAGGTAVTAPKPTKRPMTDVYMFPIRTRDDRRCFCSFFRWSFYRICPYGAMLARPWSAKTFSTKLVSDKISLLG